MAAGLLTGLLVSLLALAGCQSGGMRIDEQAAIDHYVAGQIKLEDGDKAAALAELQAAVQANPNLSVAYEAAGDIYRKSGDNENARDSYVAACNTNRYAFRPHYNLGVTYQKLAEKARGGSDMEQYFASLRDAVEVYIRAITIKPEDFDANVNLSACYFQLGKYNQAEQYCNAAIKIKADSPQAWSNLGIIYDAQNRLYDAVRAYKESLELDTNQPALLLNLGSTYMRQNRPKDAIGAFEQAAALEPENAMPWEQIGLCNFNAQDLPAALAAYEKAAQISPASAAAYRGIGVVRMCQFLKDQSNRDLCQKGLDAWNQSLELRSDQDDLRKLVEKYTPRLNPPKL